MQNRKLVEQILASAYENYKLVRDHEPNSLEDFLCRHDAHIPVWNDMDDKTKQAAITYVYKQRKKIELHSGYCQAWVQAAAYFMIWDWFYSFLLGGSDYETESEGNEFEIERFFDDLDFMSSTLRSKEVADIMGISDDFNEAF